MNPFKITCVTCRTRLTVRDESAIGQILACPKCGSMVQVLAPPGAAPLRAAPPIDTPSRSTGARSETAIPKSVQRPADQAERTPRTSAATPAAAAVTRHADADPVAAGPPAAPDDAIVSTAFEDAAEFAATDASLPSSELPAGAAATSSGGMPTWQLGAIAIGAAAVGSVLVAGAMILFGDGEQTATRNATAALPPARAESDDVPVPIDSTSAEGTATSSTDAVVEAHVASRGAKEPDISIDEPSIPAPAEGRSERSDERDAVATPLVGGSEHATADQAAAPQSETTEHALGPENTPASPEALANGESTAERAEPKLRIDPLDVDPEGLDLSLLLRGPVQDPLAASALANQPPAPSADSPPPVPQQEIDDPVRPAAGGAVQREAHQLADVAGDRSALLARRASEIHVENMQLADLIDFATQLSGVPVSVSPTQLRLAGVSAASKASCDAKDATIEQTLAAALKPLRLEPVVIDEQVVLKRSGDDKSRTVDYAVDDLVATAAEAAKLAEDFETLVFSTGDAVELDGRNWHVTALESRQYEALILLERLRLARGLPPRSKYPVSLLCADGHFVAMADRLSAPATFTFVEYAPLREVFRYWRDELDAPLLVDWPALATVHLTPWTRIVAASANQSWAASIDAVLEPLGLGWRAAGPAAIEVTTLAKLHADQHIDLYRLNDRADAAAVERVIASIRQLAKKGAGPTATQPSIPEPVVSFDPVHRILIARQSSVGHRRLAEQLRTEGFLAE